MLSNRERQTLTDMERHLLIEDPKLGAQVSGRQRSTERARRLDLHRGDRVATLFTAFAVLAAAPLQALVFATIAASVAAMRHGPQLIGRLLDRHGATTARITLAATADRTAAEHQPSRARIHGRAGREGLK